MRHSRVSQYRFSPISFSLSVQETTFSNLPIATSLTVSIALGAARPRRVVVTSCVSHGGDFFGHHDHFSFTDRIVTGAETFAATRQVSRKSGENPPRATQ